MIWRASFTAKFIEEITHRTGNYKPFGVFVKMLASAFDGDSNSVNLDLLTSEDLDALRQASGLPVNGSRPLLSSTLTKSKRYLILTYQGEFDKVHYPMALSYSETEDVAELKRAILRLRDELDIAKRTVAEAPRRPELDSTISALKAENGRLLDELDHMRTEIERNSDALSALRSENHLLRTKADVLESQLQQVRMSSRGSRAGSLVSSPSNSLRNLRTTVGSRGPSPRSRAASPSRSQQAPSPYRSTARPPLHSAVSRTNLTTSPRLASRSPVKPPRLSQLLPSNQLSHVTQVRQRVSTHHSPVVSQREPVSLPTMNQPGRLEPPVPMSEVDARLQALQNFLKHQKSMAR